MKEEIKVYIAAPFFNEKQLSMVVEIENILDHLGVEYFSPRSEGVIKDMTPEEKREHLRKIFDSNISNMDKSNMMIAVIDDYDTGTVFELGYFTRSKLINVSSRRIVTVTGNNYDLNVMLKFGTDCHLKNVNDLNGLLKGILFHEKPKHNYVFSIFDSSPEVNT